MKRRGLMNWAGKAKHYGAFIVIISPASGFYLFFVPHAHTLVLQLVSKSREREARMGIGIFQIFWIFLSSCRFNNSVFGISKLCSRSKHISKERLFEEVDHHVFFPVELHDEPDMNGLLAATSLEGCLPNAIGVNCVDPDILHEHLPLYSPDVTLETEEKLGHKIGTEESANKVELELQENKPISCLPWLNTRQHCQLENCGFHMIECTFWNRRWTVFDFYWESNIFQSASYSWAFAEVILGYEIVNNESKHAVDVINTGGKKTIYSHLKKYFCGTRFTRLPFLKRLKEKHKLGDVCVVEGSLSALLATLLAHFRYDVLDC
ncbi:hypothetical protein POTOM_031723 [Populus tomentosa]|uniref:Uncharacterized protein n=1 Tax=Populus tomentosa TaxID=118781 RepID=A0A8X7Z7U8_POPTO|nr:hypothetical protein POTOM_031723 [Populus tomentosa]